MFFDTNKPALIVGNGPSSAEVDYTRIPDEVLVFRMNMFFLEGNFFFGRSVAGFFCSVRSRVIENYLLHNLKHGEYDIDTYYTPLQREYEKEVFGQGQCVVDHWELLSRVPDIAVEMMKRPLPTQGLQALATLLILGFREIYVAGIDFYQSTDKRYSYEIPNFIKENMSQKDYRLGYERGAHSFEKDLGFYEITRRCFPSARIFSVSEKSYFSKLAPMSEVLKKENNLSSPKKIRSDIWIGDRSSEFTRLSERFASRSIKYLANLRFFRKYAGWLKKQL